MTKKYEIPVSYKMKGIVPIEADNIENAITKVIQDCDERHAEGITLIPGSFYVEEDDAREKYQDEENEYDIELHAVQMDWECPKCNATHSIFDVPANFIIKCHRCSCEVKASTNINFTRS